MPCVALDKYHNGGCPHAQPLVAHGGLVLAKSVEVRPFIFEAQRLRICVSYLIVLLYAPGINLPFTTIMKLDRHLSSPKSAAFALHAFVLIFMGVNKHSSICLLARHADAPCFSYSKESIPLYFATQKAVRMVLCVLVVGKKTSIGLFIGKMRKVLLVD